MNDKYNKIAERVVILVALVTVFGSIFLVVSFFFGDYINVNNQKNREGQIASFVNQKVYISPENEARAAAFINQKPSNISAEEAKKIADFVNK